MTKLIRQRSYDRGIDCRNYLLKNVKIRMEDINEMVKFIRIKLLTGIEAFFIRRTK